VIRSNIKTLTASEAARGFKAVIEGAEARQEEVLITRNGKPIARLVPEPAALGALEVLNNIFPQGWRKSKRTKADNK
jgi:prevent-host-death family protein